MGITGELVRSVFSRNRSTVTHETNARSSVGAKRRWSTVRSILCGDEFNSVLAEEESASVKSSEATVTQPKIEDSADKADIQSQETKEDTPKQKHISTSSLFRQEDAAIIIQSAFRNFLARHKSKEIKVKDDKQELDMGTESPSRDSVGTSIEVQTGNSAEVLSVREENVAVHNRMQKKARIQVLKLKEDWDDSTVSSNISKMRIKNRLEATNRRQRALAYAFSQQLRICSKKKKTRSNGTQPNLSWSWLERWMATRVPECSVESHTVEQLEPMNNYHRLAVRKRFFDVAVEEKESCGSNEVPVQCDSSLMTSINNSDFKPTRNKLKATRTTSRRKTAPSYKCPKKHVKATGKGCSTELEEFKEDTPKQEGSKQEINCKDAST